MNKFQEIQEYGKYMQTCRKYDFYGLKKQNISALAFKTIIHLVEGREQLFQKGINVVQIMNFRRLLTSALWPSSVFQEIVINSRKFSSSFQDNVFLSCGSTGSELAGSACINR